MRSFNQIITTLKQIIGCTTDKAVAIELHLKPANLATMKHRQKVPFKAILAYCSAHRINANQLLLGELPVEEGKIAVRYFRSLEDHGRYLLEK